MNRELIFYEKACTEYYISLVQFIWNTKVSDACLSAAILQFIPSNTYLSLEHVYANFSFHDKPNCPL